MELLAFVFICFFSCLCGSENRINEDEEIVLLVSVSDDRSGRKAGKYSEVQNKIERIFTNNPQFGISHFQMWKWSDIENTEFYQKNTTILSNIRADMNGRCYKPFIIYEGLKSLKHGDFLIYTDSSPEMWKMDENYRINPSLFDINILKKLCIKNNDILTAYVMWHDPSNPSHEIAVNNKLRTTKYGHHTHANFTLDRCIRKMGMWEYRNSLQHATGTMILRKSEESLKFVEEWLYWNSIDECASLGWINIENDLSFWNEEQFIKVGHRHDQSISGLLINKLGYSLIEEPINSLEFTAHNFLRFAKIGESYSFIDSNITK